MNESTRKHFESIGVEGVLDAIASDVFGPGKSVAKNEAEAWIAAERHRLDLASSSKQAPQLLSYELLDAWFQRSIDFPIVRSPLR